MKHQKALKAIISGKVQGVYFRAFIKQKADQLGLRGYACNLSSGNQVEVQAEGDAEILNKLVEYLKKGPAEARVDDICITWSSYSGLFHNFEIHY